MAPKVCSSDCSLCVLLGQYGLLSFPLSLQVILVHPEPGVWDLLAAAGKASPPADALPAGEAVSADRLAPLVPSLGRGVFLGHTAGEMLQGSTQRHEGIHFKSCLVLMSVVNQVAFPGL